MASKNTPYSNSRSDTRNIKIRNLVEIPAAVPLSRASENSDLEKYSDSFHYDKGLQLSDKHLIEVKDETGVLNRVNSTLGNKSSTSPIKILKTAKTSSSAIEKTTVKKEASYEEESLLEGPAYTHTPITPAKIRDTQADETNTIDTIGESQALSNGNKKECNKVISLAAKNLSDEERKQLRAKRFNINGADSSQNDKQENMARKVSTPSHISASSTANYSTPTYDTLKKRAERFGENVSTVMKSLDYKERLLKRKLKFLESVTNLKELEIKKRRAERFRMV